MRLPAIAVLAAVLLSACGGSDTTMGPPDGVLDPNYVAAAEEAGDEAHAEGEAHEGDSVEPSSEGEPSGETQAAEGGTTVEAAGETPASAAVQGVPSDFPEDLPIPSDVLRLSSTTTSGSGQDRVWSLSFGTSVAQWKEPCVGYTSDLKESGFTSKLSANNGAYVAETLVDGERAVSLSCEEGWMVVLVGPAT